MELDLAGKTAVVTGASRGVGLAIARQLMAEGVRVVGAARTITAELKEAGAHPVAADLSTPEGAEELGAQALAELGGVDILVNNLGGGDTFTLNGFLATDDALWSQSFEVNLFGTVRVTRRLLPSILERRGSIVNISSMSARLPGTGPIEYGAAKAALNAFGKALSEEFGPRGVRVNTVSPGPTRTGMWEDDNSFGARLAEANGVGHRDFLSGVPAAMGMTIGRMVEPHEVAAVVAFLASDRAASITGPTMSLRGAASRRCDASWWLDARPRRESEGVRCGEALSRLPHRTPSWSWRGQSADGVYTGPVSTLLSQPGLIARRSLDRPAEHHRQ